MYNNPYAVKLKNNKTRKKTKDPNQRQPIVKSIDKKIAKYIFK